MTGRRAALALALGVAMSACLPPPTPSPAPSGPTVGPTTSPVAGGSQPSRSPAPTPATILAIDVGQRPSGPWAVTFQQIGSEAVREVYVLAPACAEA
jgi:hypothetical protein